jgi:hypothetical protein
VTTVVSFLWGEGIRGAPGWGETYLRRLFAGLCRWATLPWRMVVFTDAANANFVPAGAERRALEPPEWTGCMPKLFAHSAQAGLKGQVLALDADSMVTGDMDPLLAWRGAFISRAGEAQAMKGVWRSGGNVQSFRAGSTRSLWELYAGGPQDFVAATQGCERFAIQKFGPEEQAFWQQERPGLIRHLKVELGADRGPARSAMGASLVIATGVTRPHQVQGELRRQWEALDVGLRLRVRGAAAKRDEDHLAPLIGSRGVQRGLRAAGVRLVRPGSAAELELVHAAAYEDGRLVPERLPDGKGPFLVVEKTDSAGVAPGHVEWLKDARVACWMKGYAMEPGTGYLAIGGRRHVAGLPEFEGEGEFERFPAGVDLCWGFGRHPRVLPFAFQAPLWERERKVDVGFAGRKALTFGAAGAALSGHRRRCAEAVRELAADGLRVWAPECRVSAPAYIRQMYDTRVAVSPWGYGESCIRDYEAVLAGCVVVKPWCGWVRDLSGIYEDGVVWCEPDWSDLGEKVKLALGVFKDSLRRLELRERVLEQWDGGVLGRMLAGRIWRAWQRRAESGERRAEGVEVGWEVVEAQWAPAPERPAVRRGGRRVLVDA